MLIFSSCTTHLSAGGSGNYERTSAVEDEREDVADEEKINSIIFFRSNVIVFIVTGGGVEISRFECPYGCGAR